MRVFVDLPSHRDALFDLTGVRYLRNKRNELHRVGWAVHVWALGTVQKFNLSS